MDDAAGDAGDALLPDEEAHDFQYLFHSLWKSNEQQKSKLRLADTVFLADNGEPLVWYFTSKDGLVKKRNSDKLKLLEINDRFRKIALKYPKNVNHYVCVRRNRGNEDPPSLVAADEFLSLAQVGASRFAGAMCLQVYIHAKGGKQSMIRCEFETTGENTQRLNVFKVVNMNSTFKDAMWVLFKCNIPSVNRDLNETVHEICAKLQSNCHRSVRRMALEFVLDENERLFFSHSAELVTVPYVPRTITVKAPTKPVKSRVVDRLYASTSSNSLSSTKSRNEACPGDYCEVPIDETDLNLHNNEPSFLIAQRSIILDRMDRAADESETAAMQTIKPALYYREVRVCARCYNQYRRRDDERNERIKEMASHNLVGKNRRRGSRASATLDRELGTLASSPSFTSGTSGNNAGATSKQAVTKFLSQLDRLFPFENPVKAAALERMSQELTRSGFAPEIVHEALRQPMERSMRASAMARSSSVPPNSRSASSPMRSSMSTTRRPASRSSLLDEFLGRDDDGTSRSMPRPMTRNVVAANGVTDGSTGAFAPFPPARRHHSGMSPDELLAALREQSPFLAAAHQEQQQAQQQQQAAAAQQQAAEEPAAGRRSPNGARRSVSRSSTQRATVELDDFVNGELEAMLGGNTPSPHGRDSPSGRESSPPRLRDHLRFPTHFAAPTQSNFARRPPSRALPPPDEKPTSVADFLESEWLVESQSNASPTRVRISRTLPTPPAHDRSLHVSALRSSHASRGSSASRRGRPPRDVSPEAALRASLLDDLPRPTTTDSAASSPLGPHNDIRGRSRTVQLSRGISVPIEMIGEELPDTAPLVVVMTDFFDTLSMYRGLFTEFSKVIGVRVLLYNQLGQAFTKHPASLVLNNKHQALALHLLLQRVFGSSSPSPGSAPLAAAPNYGSRVPPLHLIGFGNGAASAAYFVSNYSQYSVGIMAFVNGFVRVDEQLRMLLHNWVYASQFSQMMKSDFFEYFFSHLGFSSAHLARLGVERALQEIVSVSNPINSSGRAAIAKGAMNHVDMTSQFGRSSLAHPVVLVCASSDQIVSAEHERELLRAAKRDTSAPLEDIVRQRKGVHVIRVDAGHAVLHECPETLLRELVRVFSVFLVSEGHALSPRAAAAAISVAAYNARSPAPPPLTLPAESRGFSLDTSADAARTSGASSPASAAAAATT